MRMSLDRENVCAQQVGLEYWESLLRIIVEEELVEKLKTSRWHLLGLADKCGFDGSQQEDHILLVDLAKLRYFLDAFVHVG